MGFEQKFRELVQAAASKRFRNQTEMAVTAGINQGAFSDFLNGKKKSMQLETIGKILDTLGAEIVLPEERALQEATREICFVDAKVVPVGRLAGVPEAEDYIAVPLVGEAGAGPGMVSEDQLRSWVLVYRNLHSVARRSNLLAVEIGKNQRSMTPLLHPGDIILVDLDDHGEDGFRSPGNIFLVREPGQEGGGKVKRVSLSGQGANCIIIYYSENAEENEPEPYSLHGDFDGDITRAIVGKVVWAWTDLSRK